MRLLHVVPTYLPAWRHGGPVLAVHGLCKALAVRGHEVTVFTTDVHGAATLDVQRAAAVPLDGVNVWYFPVAFPRRLYRSPGLAAALAPGGAAPVTSFDLVHLHSVFLWPTASAARAAEAAGVPYLVAPRGMLVADLLRRRGRRRKRLWIRLVERRTLAHAAALHATSELEAAEALRLGLDLPPVYVVPNGVDIPGGYCLDTPVGNAVDAPPGDGLDAPPREGVAPPLGDGAGSLAGSALSAPVEAALAHRPLLLFLGRLSWKKGLDRLILALADLPGTALAIAGNDEEGYRAKLERLATAAGVAGRVHYLGPVRGADKAALLGRADLLVLASYSENFGNVVLEAMAAGLPVVVTPEVGLAAAVSEHGAGTVCDGDPPRLAAALRQLLEDPQARRAMGRRGAEAAARRFGWGTVAARMEEVYGEILERDAGHHRNDRADRGAAPRRG